MNATHRETPPELIFVPQVPFSWTLRSALSRRSARASVEEGEPSAARRFAEDHGARPELD